VESDLGAAKPDLAFVDESYREWVVAEVELGHHSFYAHVLPQVTRLRRGAYTYVHAEYLLSQDKTFNRERLIDMVKGEQPRIIVLANDLRADWIQSLARLGVDLYSLAIYKSDKEHYVFQTDLDLSALAPVLLSYCRRDRSIQAWLQVLSPGALPIGARQSIKVYFEGSATLWTRMDTRDSVYLMPVGRCPLGNDTMYKLLQRELGDFELQRAPGEISGPRRR
jgi:hypothetical protein